MARKKEDIEREIQAEIENSVPQSYNEAAVEEPPRLVDIPSIPEQNLEASGDAATPGSGGPRTFGEALETASDLTDMQAAQKRLFPPDLGGKKYNHILIGRGDPNAHLSRISLCAVDDIMHQDPLKTVDINATWQMFTTLFEVCLDGMGRIDCLELAGAAREEKRMQHTLAGLGGGM